VEWAHDHRSKINPIRDGIRMLLELLRIRMNSVLGRYEKPAAKPRTTAPELLSR
jgi:hypothetical protein